MFLTESWFWRGFQSAIFYYVSCAPLSKFSYRRKKRKEYKRAKAENAINEAEGGVHKPLAPFSTNPHWEEEIAIGPGPPVRKAQRDGRGLPEKGKQKKDRQLPTGNSTETGTSSADTVVGADTGERVRNSSEGWNKRRYQREDEILWGFEKQDTELTGIPPMSSSAGHPTYQYYARNPAINDLSPPIVSTHPTNRIETRWMLQPPPKAKVMDGKERQVPAITPKRSRSTSGGSHDIKGTLKKAPDVNLSRQVGERLMESKLKKGMSAQSSVTMSRGRSAHSQKSATSAEAAPHDGELDTSTRTRSISANRENQPPPIFINSITPHPSPSPPHPPISTIPSETVPQRRKERPPHLRPLPVTTNSASSLEILQELIAPSSQLNTINTVPTPLSKENKDVNLPPMSQQKDIELKLSEPETLFPERGWNFPPKTGGVKENGTAPLGPRWSMSI